MVYALRVSIKPSTRHAQDVTISPRRTAFMFRVAGCTSVYILFSTLFSRVVWTLSTD